MVTLLLLSITTPSRASEPNRIVSSMGRSIAHPTPSIRLFSVTITVLLNPLFPTSIDFSEINSTCHRNPFSTLQNEVGLIEIARLASDLSDLQLLQHVAVLNHERSAVVTEAVSPNGDDFERRTVRDREVSMRIVAMIVFALRKAVLANDDRLQSRQSVDHKAIHLAEAVISSLEGFEHHERGKIEETIGSVVAGIRGNDHFSGRRVHFGDHVRAFAGGNERR